MVEENEGLAPGLEPTFGSGMSVGGLGAQGAQNAIPSA